MESILPVCALEGSTHFFLCYGGHHTCLCYGRHHTFLWYGRYHTWKAAHLSVLWKAAHLSVIWKVSHLSVLWKASHLSVIWKATQHLCYGGQHTCLWHAIAIVACLFSSSSLESDIQKHPPFPNCQLPEEEPATNFYPTPISKVESSGKSVEILLLCIPGHVQLHFSILSF